MRPGRNPKLVQLSSAAGSITNAMREGVASPDFVSTVRSPAIGRGGGIRLLLHKKGHGGPLDPGAPQWIHVCSRHDHSVAAATGGKFRCQATPRAELARWGTTSIGRPRHANHHLARTLSTLQLPLERVTCCCDCLSYLAPLQLLAPCITSSATAAPFAIATHGYQSVKTYHMGAVPQAAMNMVNRLLDCELSPLGVPPPCPPPDRSQ